MSLADLRALIAHPPREFSPVPLWWWSGAAATTERLEWQVRRFLEAGVYNLVVINLAPAGPAFNAHADEPGWFTEEWWARFIELCELCERLGMRIWFYDQIGFSGANIQGAVTRQFPDTAGRVLHRRRLTVASGAVDIPPNFEALGVYATTGSRLSAAEVRDLPDGVPVDVIAETPSPFDYLDQDAVRHLLDVVHGEFERRVPQFLGTVIAGSFQDELPALNTWTARFGLMAGGRVARGASSNVGEIGHMIVDIDGPQCWCGAHGCLEMLAAPRAVVAAALNDDDLTEQLGLTRDPQRFRADYEAIARAAAQGEPRCCALIQRSAQHVAAAVLSIVNVLDLDRIVLAGPGFADAGAIYVREIREYTSRFARTRAIHPVVIELADPGLDAAAGGAATLALQHALTPHAALLP